MTYVTITDETAGCLIIFANKRNFKKNKNIKKN